MRLRVHSEINKGVFKFAASLPTKHLRLVVMILFFGCKSISLCAQTEAEQRTAPETAEQKIDRLTAAVAKAQAQMEAYQHELLELRQQLIALQQQVAAERAATRPAEQSAAVNAGGDQASAKVAATLEEIQERQAAAESQIATHDVTKVETQSKYPLTVTGLVLFNGFVNTRQVDIPSSPAYAIPGSGSSGLSLQQTVLGLDARGPHLFNATSHADLRVDFFASGAQSSYAVSGLLRLRTAHAALKWQSTEAFAELDRSILEPNEPSSLVAIAQPELAWAGNLWTWNPQIGASHRFALTDSSHIEAQAALIDTFDPQLPGAPASTSPATQSELSRWPGTEARIAFLHKENGIGTEIGAGGYFSPHRTSYGDSYDAWAGTVDFRRTLAKYFEMTANAYRGQSLGGVGGGGYVNYYLYDEGTHVRVRALEDVGGWAQLKAKAGQRLELNAGYGIDNPFANEVHSALWTPGTTYYLGLARNRSYYTNAIFSPSAYLIFSLEYRRFWSNYSIGPTNISDGIGIGAGYRF